MLCVRNEKGRRKTFSRKNAGRHGKTHQVESRGKTSTIMKFRVVLFDFLFPIPHTEKERTRLFSHFVSLHLVFASTLQKRHKRGKIKNAQKLDQMIAEIADKAVQHSMCGFVKLVLD